MSTEIKLRKPQKAQTALIKKFAKFLDFVCKDLNPHAPDYHKFLHYKKCIEKVGGVCHGLVVLHAMMYIPDNIQRGMPAWLDAALEVIAAWDEKATSLNRLVLLPNAERGVKPLRDIFEEVINHVIYNFLFSLDGDLRHPVLMSLSQSNPEKHFDLLVPAHKFPLTDSTSKPDIKLLEESKEKKSHPKSLADKLFKVKTTIIAGHFSDYDLLINLRDEKIKKLLTKIPLFISGKTHRCSLRFDDKKNGWFLHDPNNDSNITGVYRQEIFYSDDNMLVEAVKKTLSSNLKIILWELIEKNTDVDEIKEKEDVKVFSHFHKKFIKDPTPFLLNAGLNEIINQELYRTHRSRILDIIKTFTKEQINFQDSLGETLLHAASSINDVELIDILLARGADINVCDYSGRYAFAYAVMYNNLKYAELLCPKDKINESDKLGKTPLMFAVYYQAKEMQTALIEKNADVNIPNKNGFTPLMVAAAQSDTDSMQVLLEAKPNINHQNQYGQTALMQAVIHENKKKSKQKSGPLLIDANAEMQKAVKLLIDANADITLTDKEGHTALELAAIHGRFDLCEIILSAAISQAKKESSSEESPADSKSTFQIQTYKEIILRYAAAQNNSALVEQYLDEGVNFKAVGAAGLDAFGLAAIRGNFDICAKLFDFKKSQIKEKSPQKKHEIKGETSHENQELARDIAEKIKNEELLQCIAEAMGIEQSLWLNVAKYQSKRALKWVLDKSPRIAITEQDELGETALTLAAAKGDGEMIDFLLKEAKDKAHLINLETERGETAFTIAVQTGRMDIVKRLVDNGADLSGIIGAKALIRAIHRHDQPMLHYLLINGAQNLPINGSTPLHLASQQSSASAQLILNYSRPLQNLNAADSYGLTAKNHAAIRDDNVLVKLFTEKGADNQQGLSDHKLLKFPAESKKSVDPSSLLPLALMQRKYEVARFLLDQEGAIIRKIKSPGESKEKILLPGEIICVPPQGNFVPICLNQILNDINTRFVEIIKIFSNKENFPANRQHLPAIFEDLDKDKEKLDALFSLRPELAAQMDKTQQTPAQYLLEILKWTKMKMRGIYPERIYESSVNAAEKDMSHRLDAFASSLARIDCSIPTIDFQTLPVDILFFKNLRKALVTSEDSGWLGFFKNGIEARELRRKGILEEYGLSSPEESFYFESNLIESNEFEV